MNKLLKSILILAVLGAATHMMLSVPGLVNTGLGAFILIFAISVCLVILVD